MNGWTPEEMAASALTVSVVDKNGKIVRRFEGDEARRAEQEYMDALNKSSKINETLSI